MQPTLDYIKASNGTDNASLMTIQSVRAPGATTINVNTVAGVPARFAATMGEPHSFLDPVTNETITIISEATAVDFFGSVDSGQLQIDEIAPGYVDTRGSAVGDIVIIRPTTQWADLVAQFLTPTGMISPFAGTVAPANWLLCDGASLDRTAYPRLFDVVGTTYGSVDSTHFNVPNLRGRNPLGAGAAATKDAKFVSRSGNVLTLSGMTNLTKDEFQTGQAVLYKTTGTTIGGLTNNTTYYIRRLSATTFSLATTRVNAVNNTVITLSADGSGDRTFTFSLSARTLGETGGEERHALITDEQASHTHTPSSGAANWIANQLASPGTSQLNQANGQLGTSGMNASGGSNDHNIMNPFVALNYIIKT